MLSERKIPLKNICLSGLELNPEGPQKVLAFHGWLDNAASFLPLAKHLPKDIHLLSIDLPGHGNSDWRPPGSSYHFLDYVTDIHDLLDTLEFENCVLMGHSLGAAIASIAGAVFRKRVQKLVLIEGLGPLSNTGDESPDFYEKYLRQHMRAPLQANFSYDSFEEVLEKRMRASPMAESSARIILERSLEEKNGKWFWKSDPKHMGRNPSRLTEEQVIAFLKRIDCPALAIEADRGEYYHFHRKVLPGRLQAVKQLSHSKIVGEHHVHMDQPELVWPIIASFLSARS